MANYEQAVTLEVFDLLSSETQYGPPLEAMGIARRTMNGGLRIGFGPIDSRRIDLILAQSDEGLEMSNPGCAAILLAPSVTAIHDFYLGAISQGFDGLSDPQWFPSGYAAVVMDDDGNLLEVCYHDDHLYDEAFEEGPNEEQDEQPDYQQYYYLFQSPRGWTRARDIDERIRHRWAHKMAPRRSTQYVPPTGHPSSIPLHRRGMRREQGKDSQDDQGEEKEGGGLVLPTETCV